MFAKHGFASVFDIHATECMLINPKAIFRRYATFSERKKIQKFPVFFKKMRLLSLKYSADFRRSRLAYSVKETYKAGRA